MAYQTCEKRRWVLMVALSAVVNLHAGNRVAVKFRDGVEHMEDQDDETVGCVEIDEPSGWESTLDEKGGTRVIERVIYSSVANASLARDNPYAVGLLAV